MSARTTSLLLLVGVVASAADSSAQWTVSGGRPREYRLVSDRLDAANLSHARLVESVTTRADRTSSFTVGLSTGARAMGLTDLNQEFARNGYSQVGTRATFGIGSAWYGKNVFFGLFLEGGPNSIRSSSGVSGNVGFIEIALQGGPVWSVRNSGLVYPFLGLGVSQTSVLAQTNDTLRTPILRNALPLSQGLDVFKTLGTLELGVGWLAPVPLVSDPEDRYGVGIGTELGYLCTFAESDWRDSTAGPNPPSYSGPSGAVNGAFVRFVVRYLHDGFTTRTGDHAVPSCDGTCHVVCDPGYADCDADARNGCETRVGTVENCGGCGDSCSVRHGSGVCGAPDRGAPETTFGHKCSVAACDPGYMNCNGWLLDGCETLVGSDVFNCGACGHLCTPVERCSAGKCVPKDVSDVGR